MSEYLTGVVADLSGRVLDIEKTLVGLPSKKDFTALSQSNSSQFNTISTDLTSLTEKLNDMLEYVVNLKLNHNSLEASFTGHTGAFVFATGGQATTGAHVGDDV